MEDRTYLYNGVKVTRVEAFKLASDKLATQVQEALRVVNGDYSAIEYAVMLGIKGYDGKAVYCDIYQK